MLPRGAGKHRLAEFHLRKLEIERAQNQGFQDCRLGPRVLRVETAPLAALASLQALMGDF